jgi:hypothetical protein
VTEEGGDGEAARSETPSLLSFTLRYVSFTEVVSICRVVLREPIQLCTCMTEEGVDGEAADFYLAACSETPSLLSYTRRYVSLAEVGRVCRVALREPMHLCTCMSEEGSSSFNKTTHFLFLFFLPFLGGRSELFFFPNGK